MATDWEDFWPCKDPPVQSYFEKGQLHWWKTCDVVYVTVHLSGWHQYQPARFGLGKLYSGYNSEFRQKAMKIGLSLLRQQLGVAYFEPDECNFGCMQCLNLCLYVYAMYSFRVACFPGSLPAEMFYLCPPTLLYQ